MLLAVTLGEYHEIFSLFWPRRVARLVHDLPGNRNHLWDFKFPNHTCNATPIKDSTERTISEFREITMDFFLPQLNLHPTRVKNILDLFFPTPPTMSLTSRACCPRHWAYLSLGSDNRTVVNFSLAGWLSSAFRPSACKISKVNQVQTKIGIVGKTFS